MILLYPYVQCIWNVADVIVQDILNTEMEVVSARGLEVELVDGIEEENQDLRELRRLVQLDGEMYSLETPSFQLW